MNEFVAIAVVIGLAVVAVACLVHISRRKRRRGARAFASLSAEQRAEFARATAKARRVAIDRPWHPVRLQLSDVQMDELGVRLRASGTHDGRSFGFGLSLSMHQGPVALCDWSRQDGESDVFLDLLAHFANQQRGDRRFADLVRTSAIILYAKPNNVPFPQLAEIHCKIFFELAENQPELLLDLDFAKKTGSILEKDPLHRDHLLDAFQDQQLAETT